MRQPSAYGSSTATLLLCASLLGLTACGKSLTRPTELQPIPSVPCDARPLTVPPMVPEPAQMDVWALQMLGLYQQAAVVVTATNECLRDLRASGVIR